MGGHLLNGEAEAGGPAAEALRADAQLIDGRQKPFLEVRVIGVGVRDIQRAEQSFLGEIGHFIKAAAHADAQHDGRAGVGTGQLHGLHHELLELVEMEIRELLSEYDFPGDDIPVIQGSALKALEDPAGPWGDKIMELMNAVDEYIPDPQRDTDKPFVMPVEDVFSITGRGTVATGRVEAGVLHVSDEVEIVGIHEETKKTVVTGVEMFRKLLDEAQAGDNIGALLRGIQRTEIERGQVLCKPGSVTCHHKFTAQVYVLTKDEGGRHTPFFNNYRPQFYFRTTDVTGVCELPEGVEMCMPGDNVEMTIELIHPVAMEQGLRFAIREGGRTVGSGRVATIIE